VKNKIISLSFLIFLSSGSLQAGLLGDTIDWQYYAGEKYNFFGSPGSFVAGSTTDTFDTFFTISASDTQIIFDYFDTSSTWSDFSTVITDAGMSIDNGLELFNIDSLISSVSVNASTNMAGFSSSNVDFTGSAIAVDWEGLSYNSNTLVVLDINSTDEVPAPAPLALMGLGLAALGFSRRKKAA